MLKNPPVTQETRARSLVREDPLKEGMATHLSILAWRIPWTEEPGGLPSMGSHITERLTLDLEGGGAWEGKELHVQWTK